MNESIGGQEMYESFFELHARPFLSVPLAERYFPASSAEHARETAARCVERAEGPAVIIGPAGTGKSMLCHVLAEQFRNRFPAAMLASARLCTRRALLQNILFELKRPYRDREEGELRLALIDYLQPSEDCPDGILLLVDEAHMLPLRLLEEIRMITNLVRDGQPRVRLVLAASLVFDERLASPRLESFNQRVAARCYLQSMTRDETRDYVRAQIAAVGGDPDRIFTEDAVRAVFQATDGIPRLVNQVCDHALVLASIGQCQTIDASGIEEAWADLQQLPTPWNAGPTETRPVQHDILEFGALDDEPDGESDANSDQPPSNDMETAWTTDEQEGAQPPGGVATGSEGNAEAEAAVDRADPDDEDSVQFRPLSENGPEIELVFHQAHDPFVERFEEEEVIVDPFISLEKLSSSRTSVERHEGDRETIPLCEHAVSDGERQAIGESNDSKDGGSPESEQDAIAIPLSEDSASDPWLPNDDRDLLEIVEDTRKLVAESAAAAAPKPKRRQYRRLFATLRRR